MTAHLGAARYERGERPERLPQRHKPRSLTTRVGTIELRVPQDRDGTFSTELFARYQRSEQALVTTLMEMYLQGVSTRNVAAITEELCGTALLEVARLGRGRAPGPGVEGVAGAAADRRRLPLPGRRRPVRARTGGRAGGDAGGAGRRRGARRRRREVLAVEEADTESEATYHDLFTRLKARGLRGVELVTSDDHRGLKAAIDSAFPGGELAALPGPLRPQPARDGRGQAPGTPRRGPAGDLRGGDRGAGAGRGPRLRLGLEGAATPRWRPSWRRRSRTASPVTPSRRRTDRACGRPTAWSGSTRN